MNRAATYIGISWFAGLLSIGFSAGQAMSSGPPGAPPSSAPAEFGYRMLVRADFAAPEPPDELSLHGDNLDAETQRDAGKKSQPMWAKRYEGLLNPW